MHTEMKSSDRKDNMKECNKPYTITHVADLDIDDLATVPDYFLGVREVESPNDGNTIYTPVRIPGARVMPTGNLANITAIATNNTALEIPENQILGGYLDAQPGGNVMKPAGEHHPAMFIMVKNYANGKMLIQTTGFLTFPNTGQKLFFPLDDYTLNINGEF